MRVNVNECVCVDVCVCACECECACVRSCVCACVCVREREREGERERERLVCCDSNDMNISRSKHAKVCHKRFVLNVVVRASLLNLDTGTFYKTLKKTLKN